MNEKGIHFDRANPKRVICEVLREINDELQGNPKQKVIFRKLVEAEDMAKRMAKQLYKYNKQFDAGWWADNPDYERDFLRRLDKRYVTCE